MDYTSLVGTTGRREFVVERSHTTNCFGPQDDPPLPSAAADADPEESVRVFGTPGLLAWVEFVGRESLRGRLPEGMGCAGERASVEHFLAVPEGALLAAETQVVAVDGSRLSLEGGVTRVSTDETVGTVETDFRVVDRGAFRERVA
jgi:predicted thioesterase